MKRKLTRSKKNRMLAGVCGGVAEYTNLDPNVVRIVWVLTTAFPPTTLVGLAGYFAAWLIVPETSSASA
ncbi:MAG: PspC domain-containing protein [bacterium]|jgi:phage shock protein C